MCLEFNCNTVNETKPFLHQPSRRRKRRKGRRRRKKRRRGRRRTDPPPFCQYHSGSRTVDTAWCTSLLIGQCLYYLLLRSRSEV
jgi:hypothetical protein